MHCRQLSWYDVSTTLRIYRSDIGLQHDPHVVIVVVFIYFISMGTETGWSDFFFVIQYVLQIIYAIFIIRFNLFLFNIQRIEHQVQKQILKFILNSASPLYPMFSVVLFKFKNHKYIQQRALYVFCCCVYRGTTVFSVNFTDSLEYNWRGVKVKDE